ncbi:MAG: YihY/virulence factor BrkB family protein [Bacteroidia bacterium]|nr:YihY/virulence factor BrkB family protein [Bacteroidia bacterium]
MNLPPVRAVLRLSKRTVPPGFGGISVYEAGVYFRQGLTKGALPTRAAALAYNFFLALFPSVIFLFTLIPYVPIEDFQPRLMETIRMVMPENAYAATEETIQEILTRQNGGLLSLGFLMALYFSTNGFNSMINAFNNTFHELEKRNVFMQRLVSLALVLIFVLILVLGVGTLVTGEWMLAHVVSEGSTGGRFLVNISRWLVLFLLFWVMISSAYFMAPARRNRGWKFFSPGSLIATLLSIVTSLGFAYFVNHFGSYNKIYGSLGTLIVVMMWIYLNSLVLLLGFEINASIHSARRKKILAEK